MICQLCPECAVDDGEPCRRKARPLERTTCPKCNGSGLTRYEAMGESCAAYCDCEAALHLRLLHVSQSLADVMRAIDGASVSLRAALRLSAQHASAPPPQPQD